MHSFRSTFDFDSSWIHKPHTIETLGGHTPAMHRMSLRSY